MARKYTNKEFLELLNSVRDDVEILEEYCGMDKRTLFKCKKCGYEWLMTPSNILHGNGCLKCRLSKLEIGLKDFLKEKNIEFEWQIKNDYFEWLNRQSLDFYLPQYNIVIECQGEQHFKPIKHFGGVNRFVDTIERDKKKKDLITENNLTIFYMVEKRFKKYIDSNIILKEIYSDANILWVQTDHYGNLKNNKCLYCFWKDNK